jgi:hypothetical protein
MVITNFEFDWQQGKFLIADPKEGNKETFQVDSPSRVNG